MHQRRFVTAIGREKIIEIIEQIYNCEKFDKKNKNDRKLKQESNH